MGSLKAKIISPETGLPSNNHENVKKGSQKKKRIMKWYTFFWNFQIKYSIMYCA